MVKNQEFYDYKYKTVWCPYTNQYLFKYLDMIELTALMLTIFKTIVEILRKNFILYLFSNIARQLSQLDQRRDQIYWRFRLSSENGLSQKSRLALKEISSWQEKMGIWIVINYLSLIIKNIACLEKPQCKYKIMKEGSFVLGAPFFKQHEKG